MNIDEQDSGFDRIDHDCCSMRRHVLLAIVGTVGEMPIEAADFITHWRPKIILRARFCCWCGQKLPPEAPVVVVPR